MRKRLTSVLAVMVALSGFALAVFIPAASAKKADANVYTQYCEYTEYSEYNEYCEPQTTTTVQNGTTTVVTSPGFTITNTPTVPATPGPATPAVTVSKDGSAVIDVKSLTVGEKFTANGVAVVVLATTADGVEMSFGGVAVDVPSTAAVAISKNGTVTVTYFKTASGKLIPAFKSDQAAAFHPVAAIGQQDIILPAGKTSQSFRYLLTKGVSFPKTSFSQLAKVFTVQATGKHSLRSTLKPAKLANVAFSVSANKARTAVSVKLAKAQSAYVVKFNVAKLQYTKAEATYITSQKVKTLTPRFTVVAKTGKKTSSFLLPFTYPVA